MPTEIELKLALDPRAAVAAARLPWLHQRATGKPVTRILRSSFFDTPAADLRAAGATLRLRRVNGVWLQEIKEARAGTGGLHVRAESSHVVASGEPDPGQIKRASLRKKIGKWLATGELAPRFETVVRRTTWLLNTAEGSVVECALDRGAILTADGRHKLPLCELELELKSGATAPLFSLARVLAQSLPLALEGLSKAERGYALWRREPLTLPRKAGPLRLQASETAAQALAAILGNGLRHLQHNAQSARAAVRYDPEHVHQMRVASRRLRTAIALFGKIDEPLKAHPLRTEMRWLASQLGEARNWDVLLAETFPKLRDTFPQEPALQVLERRAMRRRRRARLAVGEALHSPRYFALVLNLNEFAATVHERRGLAQAAVPVGATLLSGCYRQLRRRAKHLVDGTTTERHAVRIAAKKLRYTADFFGSLFAGRKCDKFVRALSKVQEALGLLNDLATTRTLMASLAVGEDMQVQRTLGLCIGWSSGLEQGLITELARCWKGVERAARFWPEAADQASIAKGANDSLPDDGSPVTSL